VNFKPEEDILEKYLSSKGLKNSQQRLDVLRVFLETEAHLTPEELHALVKKKFKTIGIATIYRTLKLLCNCGLAKELLLESGATRYEHSYGHNHHDHLICTQCGKVLEVIDPEIEKLQEQLARKHQFYTERHRMEIYGVCRQCKK